MVRVIAGLLVVLAVSLYLLGDLIKPKLSGYQRSFECGTIGQECKISDREYNALIPEGEGPFPAVLFLHGSGGSGQKIIGEVGLVQPILDRGYAIIAPTALEISYNSGPGTGWVWNATAYGRDDFDFIAATLVDGLKNFPIDSSRVLVAGHSRGSTFAWYLACADVDPRLRTFAPIGGTPIRNRPHTCRTSDFDFNMLYSHGYADDVIPFSGTRQSGGWPGYMGAVESVHGLALEVDCQPEEVIQYQNYDRQNLSECTTGSDISIVGYQGGHSIPIGWTDLILDWFEGVTTKNS